MAPPQPLADQRSLMDLDLLPRAAALRQIAATARTADIRDELLVLADTYEQIAAKQQGRDRN
jgi:hypothetical protein